MAVGVFNSKIFNPQVFQRYVNTIPRVRLNMLQRSGVIVSGEADWATRFPDQAGGWYGVVPLVGRISDEYNNYDGRTDMELETIDTYLRGVVAYGRMRGFYEWDFTWSITGHDFLAEMAQQTVNWEEDQDENALRSVLKGVFSMDESDPLNGDFVRNHTYDISTLTGDDAKFGVTTLNTAMQRAAGDAKAGFAAAVMHSAVATNLENLNLVEHLKFTDANGVQRDLELATLNGRLVIIDDAMVLEGAPDTYETFVLGRSAISHTPLPVKNPYEMGRDPEERGGVDKFYVRKRDILSPFGISFTKTAVATESPQNDELALGANWEIVRNEDRTAAISHKAIRLARIISKG